MPSLRTFRIEFERPNATYMPGETVSGNILVDVTKVKRFRGLSISTKGEARVSWSEYITENDIHGRSSRRYETYSNFEEYFHQKHYVLGSNSFTSQIEIPVGLQRYPFTFQLPYNIPSSFEHKYGHVRYVVKATIDRPWAFNHECKVAFTVVSSLNLNEHRYQCCGIDDDVMQSFCCFCCIDEGKMNLHIRVPATGYVPGQSIFVAVQYRNTSSSVEITGISTKLMRKLKFRAGAPSTNEKTERSEIKSTRDSGPFSTNGCSMLEFSVPPIPPSHLEYCSIIDLEYELVVTTHVSGTHYKVERSYPLLIGTVPIYCPPSAPPMATNPIPTCSGSDTTGSAMIPMPMPMPIGATAPYPPTDKPVGDLPRLSVHSESIVVHPPKHTSIASPNWDIPPPTYEECMSGAENIMDHDESNYVYGANDPFTPRYPVFHYPAPSKFKDLLCIMRFKYLRS
ncbi:arrestin domain-containing protein 17 [Xylocopa sonorina]|uniref:arrestin domain-containing protein 17 n=1 Tax=Xylocopa sonorina TaxID=1818115 RepID=UPI00403AC83E